MSKKTQIDKKRTYRDMRTELYRSEQRFRDIAEVASDWFWETDSDHRFTYISDKFYEISSISPKEVIGKTRLEFISDHERRTNPKKWKDHEDTLLNRRPFRNLEYQVPTPDGRPCYIRISGKAFFSEDDIFLGYRGAGSDITAQKVAEREQVESALRASENEYRLTLNDLRIGVVVHAGDTSILLSNPEATNILGLTYEQMSGKKAIDPAWNFVHEDLSIMKVGDYPVSKVLSTKKPLHDYVLGIRRPDRDYVTWVIVNASPVFSVDNELEKVVVNFVDITARMQAEEALRQSKERLEKIVNNAVMGIYQVTHEGKFLLVNYRFAEMFGYKSPEEFLASVENIHQLYVHPEERASVLEKINTKNFLDDFEIQFWNRDGEIVLARVSVRAIEDKTKRIIYEGFMADITEQKRVEEALRESEEVYRTLVESANSIILIWDTKGHIIYLNPYGLEYFKYGKEEVIGKHVLGTIVPKNENTGRDLREMIDNITKNPLEYKNNLNQNICSDGELVWVAWTNEAILDESGKFVQILSIGNDITERKQAEEALRESEERFRTVADFTYDWESWIGPDGKYIYVSPSCERITGYSPKEFLESTGLLESITHPDDRKKISVHLHDDLKWDDEVLNIDFRIISRSGNTRWISHICQPVYDSDGNWAGRRASNRDITKQREVEAQLQRAEKMEAMGTLAGRVAHDLNNVLSGIVSYPDLLLMELPEDSPLRKPILTMKNSGEKAVDIVQDLLTMARRGVVVSDLVNLNDIISEYLKSAEHERLISYHPEVEVKTKLEADLLNLSGSPVHLSKIVMNLVSNAAEAISDGGKIFISTENRYVDKSFSRYDSIKEGDYVVLAVSDTGVGISSQDIEKIFEPFYTKKVMGRSGTGLGMAVVWGTVKDHNGYIDVQSTEGKGTKFTIYFPATREKIAKEKARLSIEDYMGKEESILVVDDVKEQRELALALLITLGYAVDAVSSGEEAVEYLKEHTVDLIVLDMIMDPGIDGLETYKKIIEVHPGQKAIIASGFSETDRVKEAQRLGAGQYIKKPYTLEKIGLAIKEELGK